jgi:hypothetical protein
MGLARPGHAQAQAAGHVYILAGELYVEALKLNRIPGVTVLTPLEGKPQGKRVKWLQEQNASGAR